MTEAAFICRLKASMVKQIGPIACQRSLNRQSPTPNRSGQTVIANITPNCQMVKAILYHQPLMTQRVLMRSHQ